MKHKIGDVIPIGPDLYIVREIINGEIHLRKPNGRGKPKIMHWREVPYFENGELVTPNLKKKPKINSRFNLGGLFKKNTELQVTKEFIALAFENIEGIILELLDIAEQNAVSKGHKRLIPAHWYYLELPMRAGKGYWPEQNDYAIKESIWDIEKK
jgi:hypothetical protein